MLTTGLIILGNCIAVLMVWAGVLKLVDRQQFLNTLIAITGSLKVATACSFVVPMAEIVSGVFALFSFKYGFVVLGFLLSMFILVALRSILTKQTIKCNCFGNSSELLSWPTISRNAMLIAIVLSNSATPPSKSSMDVLSLMGISIFLVAFGGAMFQLKSNSANLNLTRS